MAHHNTILASIASSEEGKFECAIRVWRRFPGSVATRLREGQLGKESTAGGEGRRGGSFSSQATSMGAKEVAKVTLERLDAFNCRRLGSNHGRYIMEVPLTPRPPSNEAPSGVE